jgi:murein DD-endopeptidase MepM/ murein hydrolase activator NlpD
LVGVAQGQEIGQLWRNRQDILTTSGNADEISAALNERMNLHTYSAQPPHLLAVAFKGENLGGSDSFSSSKSIPVDPSKKDGTTQYTVMAGDTLSGIANKFNLHSGSIVLANAGLDNTEVLQIGQILSIPAQDVDDASLMKEMETRKKKLAAVTQSTTTKTSRSKTQSTVKASGLVRPVSYSYISQYFSKAHPGEDMVAPVYTPIRAAQSGCVTTAAKGWNGGYGNYIILSHGGGFSTLYAHQAYFADGIVPGACVDAGEVIGYVGLTGRTSGAHLHFEARQNGVPINPGF